MSTATEQIKELTDTDYKYGFVTDVDTTTGRNLIDSMGTEVVVHDDSIRRVVPGETMSYREAVRLAPDSVQASMVHGNLAVHGRVITSWHMQPAMPDGSRHSRNFRTKMDAEACRKGVARADSGPTILD